MSAAPPRSVTKAVQARIDALEGGLRSNLSRRSRKDGAANLKLVQSLTKARVPREQLIKALEEQGKRQAEAKAAFIKKTQDQINKLRTEFLAQEQAKFQKVLADRAAAARRTSKQQAQSAAIKEQEARALGTVVGTRQEGTPVLIGSQFAEAEKLKAAGVDVKLNEQGGRDLSLELTEALKITDEPVKTDLVKGIEGGGRAFNVDLAENIGFSDVREPAPKTITVQVGEPAPEPIPEDQIAKRDFELDLATGQLTTKITTKPQVEAAKQQVAEQQAFGDLLASGQAIIPNIESLAAGQAILLPPREEKKEGTVIRQEGLVDRVDQPPAPTTDQQLEQTITNLGSFAQQQSKESDVLFSRLFGERRLGGESLKGGKATALEKTLANIGLFGSGVSKFVTGAGAGLLEEGLATFAFGVNLERQGAPIFKQLVTGGQIETKPIEIGGTGRFRTFINLPTGRIIGGQVTSLDRNVAQIKIPETAPSAALGEVASQSTVDIGGSLAGGIRQSGQGLRSFLETGDSSKLLAGVGSFEQAGAGISGSLGRIGKIAQEQGVARSVGQTAFLFLPVTPKGFRQLVPIAVGRIPITTGALKTVTKVGRVGGLEIKAFGKTLGAGGKVVTKQVTEPEVLRGAITFGLGFGGKRTIALGGRSAIKGILNESSRSPVTSQISKALAPSGTGKRGFFLGSPTRKIENLGLENLNTIDRGLELATLRGFERSILTSEKSFKELVKLQKIRPDDPELFKTLEGIANLVKKTPSAKQLKKFADPEVRAPLTSLRAGEESKAFFKLLPTLPKAKGGLAQNLQTLSERITGDVDIDFAGIFRGERKALTSAQKGERELLEAQRLTGNIRLTKAEAKALGIKKAGEVSLPRGSVRQGTKVFTGFKVGETIQFPKVSLKRDEFLHGTTIASGKKILDEGIDLSRARNSAFFTTSDQNLAQGFAARAAGREGGQQALVKLVLKDTIGFRGLKKLTDKKLKSRSFDSFQKNVIDTAKEAGFKTVLKPYKSLDDFAKRTENIVFDASALKKGEVITPLTTQDRLVGKDKFLELLTSKDAIGDAARTSPPKESGKGKQAFGISPRKPTIIKSEFFARQTKPFKLGLNPIKKTFGKKQIEVVSLQDNTLNQIASASAIQSSFTEGSELIGRQAAINLSRRGVGIAEGRIGTPTFRFKDIASLTSEGAALDTLSFLFKERAKKRGVLGRTDLARAEKLTTLKNDLIRLTPEVDLEAFALKNKLPKGQKSLFKDPAAAKAAEGFASTKTSPKTFAGAKLKKQSDSLNKIIDNQIDTRPPSVPLGKRASDLDITSSGSLAAKNADKVISGLGSINPPSTFSSPRISKQDAFISKTIDNLTSFSKSPFDNSMSRNLNSITKISTPSSLPASQVSPVGFSPQGSLGKISKPSVNLSSLPSFPSVRSPSRPSTLSPPSPVSPPRVSPPSPASRPRPSTPRIPRGSAPSRPIGTFPIIPPPKPIKLKVPRIFLGKLEEEKRRRKLPSFKKSLTFIADPPDPERAGVLLPKGVTQLVSGKSDIFKQIDKNLAKARQKAGAFVPLGEVSRRAAGITPRK
jgi:hypothetical protein